jgi:ribose 5-phosphate isomerase B
MTRHLTIASDHAGLSLKNFLLAELRKEGWNVDDMGTHTQASCDYPEFAHAACANVLEKNCPGILVCGTGIGMSMAANRHKGIRAAVCTHEFHARAAREHNNANVLCLGERVTAPGLALELARIFLATEFEGGRHERRTDKIETE